MTPGELLGRRVIGTNERGGRWRGLCTTFRLDGRAVLECDAVDIGYGWHPLRGEVKVFDVDRVEVVDGDD